MAISLTLKKYLILQGQMAAEKKEQEERKVVPHFWNLNEDPSLTGMIIHFCREGTVTPYRDLRKGEREKKAPLKTEH